MTATQTEAARPSETTEEWLTVGRFALVLGLLIFASYPGVVLGQTTFVVRDYGLFGYPLAYFHRQSFWRGHLPLWNPLNGCGMPFLAQWNTLTLYPLSLIYLLFPLAWSLSFFCLAHQFWGGLGMCVLAHRWTGSRTAAALAGLIYSFNGLALNFLMWPNMIAAYGWLPWVVWLTQRALQQGGKLLVWATLAGAMQMLSGGPETILLTWGFLGLLAVGEWLHSTDGRHGGRSGLIFLRFFSIAILVALVCAAQLLPFLKLLSHSQRDESLGAAQWAMPVWGWANFFVPLFRCGPTVQGWYQQAGQYWTSSYYAGIGTLLLAAAGVWRTRDWYVRMLAGLIVLCLVLALGDRGWLYAFLYSWVPGFGLVRYPVKFVILILALAPLLGAFGLTALERGNRGLGRFEWSCGLVIVLVIGAILWFGWRFPSSWQVWPATWQNGLVRCVFLAGTLLVVAAFLKCRGRRRILLAGLLLLLFWLDFTTHLPDQNPTVRPSVYTPGWACAHLAFDGGPPRPGKSRLFLAPAAHQALRSEMLADPADNYLLNREAFFADCNLLENVPAVYGFFSLTWREAYFAMMLPYVRLDREFPVLLDFMGVTQTTARGKSCDWVRRPTAMPFVTAGQLPVPITDDKAFAAFSQTNVDLREVVYLPPDAGAQISATRQPAARAEVTQFADQRISIRAESPATCMVVVSQTFYPAWRAYVDGRSAKVWRANYAFQAIEVPGGAHRLELRYEDQWLTMGAVISFLGLALCLALWWRGRRGRRENDEY